ncbi:MAG: hypothetical protein RI907_1136 [Pseudomonadota bacterium]|jgi:beta-mannosidase
MAASLAVRWGALARPLVHGWRLGGLPAGSAATPADIEAQAEWLALAAPMPVAAALAQAGQAHPEGGLDSLDWVYQCTLPLLDEPEEQGDGAWSLAWAAMPPLTEVWLDDVRLAQSDSEFLPGAVALGATGEVAERTLTLVCRSLDRACLIKRPRPAWKAPMVRHQQLRWWRSSLFGRCPSWTPDVPAIGPLGPLTLQTPGPLQWTTWVCQPRWRDGRGLLRVRAMGQLRPGVGLLGGALTLQGPEGRTVRHDLPVTLLDGGQVRVDVDLALALGDVAPWWPHTHGQPACHAAQVAWQLDDGRTLTQPLAPLAFREARLDTAQGEFNLHIQGLPVFCRGVNLLPPEPKLTDLDEAAWRQALQPYVDAGMNMVRLPGNTRYGSEAFYRSCDALGLMVWQDFMFSNLDYPVGDEAFDALVKAEVLAQVERLSGHGSLVVWCGNSEVSQQALMYAAPRERWFPALFHELMPAWLSEAEADVPYWPSSVHGGGLPCRADVGTTSYYGVGVYLRELSDARRSGLRFATECLGLANEPDARVPGGWAPQNAAIGGDFVAVREHYTRLTSLASADEVLDTATPRGHRLACITSAEVMAEAFEEWRRDTSACRGALIWWGRDVQPGAGFGILDHQGHPKTPWHALKRVLRPRALSFSDEGGNGLFVHAVNETPEAVAGRVHLMLLRADGSRVDEGTLPLPLSVGPWSSGCVAAGDAFDWFLDLNAAYRFGPPPGHVLVARWLDAQGVCQAEHVGLPAGRRLPAVADLGWQVQGPQARPDGGIDVRVTAATFAQSVMVVAPGWVPSDQAFHLLPGVAKVLTLRPATLGARPEALAELHALNGPQVATWLCPALAVGRGEAP